MRAPKVLAVVLCAALAGLPGTAYAGTLPPAPEGLTTVEVAARPLSAGGTVSRTTSYVATQRYRVVPDVVRPGQPVVLQIWEDLETTDDLLAFGCARADDGEEQVQFESNGIQLFQTEDQIALGQGRPLRIVDTENTGRDGSAYTEYTVVWPEWASRGNWTLIAPQTAVEVSCPLEGNRPSGVRFSQTFTGEPAEVRIESGTAPLLGELDLTLAAVLLAAGATPLVLAAVGFPADVVNKTLESNRPRVRLWRRRRGRRRLPRWVTTWAAFLATTLACLWLTSDGLFYSGAITGSLATGLTAILAVVLLYEGPRYAVLHGTPRGMLGSWRVVPAGLLLALVLAGISRLGNLFPPYVYGLTVGPRDQAASARRRAYSVVAGAGSLTGVLLVAWAVYSSSTAAAVRTGRLGEWLSTFFFSALQGLVFALVPAAFLDGAELWGYRRRLWAAVHAPIVALYVWVMFTGAPQWWGARSEAWTSAALLVAFAVLSLLVWLWFRLTPEPRPAAPAAAPDPGLQVWEDEGGATAPPPPDPEETRTGVLRPAVLALGVVTVAAVVTVVATTAGAGGTPPPPEPVAQVRAAEPLPDGEIVPPPHGEQWRLDLELRARYPAEVLAGLPPEFTRWVPSGLSGDALLLPCEDACAFTLADLTTAGDETGETGEIERTDEAEAAAGTAFTRTGEAYTGTWRQQADEDCRGARLRRTREYRLTVAPSFSGPDDFGVTARVTGTITSSAARSTDGRCYSPVATVDLRGTATRTQ